VCFSEGDFLPGVIIDTYDGFAVFQILTAGAERRRDDIVEAISAVLKPKGIFERSDTGFRIDEGLVKRTGPVSGEVPPERLPVLERGVRLIVDIARGQKTGLYLDQRASRGLVASIASGRTVLNAFSYTGAFGAAAGAAGATRTVNVDSSAGALALARATYDANGLPVRDEDFVEADVFDYLRETDETFDIVILDPPAFAKSQASVPRALRGYKEIIMRGLDRTKPGGFLFTFSCSGHVDAALFQKVVFGAALDVRRDVQILARLGHSFDHPINVYHPEGEYLCGYFLGTAGEGAI
jgi:23S rRNA (cytosine1962-C5)-methyltransferase